MPDFRIRNSEGFTIGSIEQKTDLSQLFQTYFQASQAIRFAQLSEIQAYIDSIHVLFTDTYNLISAFDSKQTGISLEYERSILIPASQRFLSLIENGSTLNSPKKIIKYFEENIKPEAEKASGIVRRVYDTILRLEILSNLFCEIREYIKFHNASCDRLESQGFDLEKVTEESFLKLNKNWYEKTDVLINYFDEILNLIEKVNNTPRNQFPVLELQELVDRQPELSENISTCVNLTEGREKAALRLLDVKLKQESPSSISQELEKLVILLKDGHLNEEEFKILKNRLIQG